LQLKRDEHIAIEQALELLKPNVENQDSETDK
jgi:hypothetical protein